ncbi:HPHL1-like protein [Mya arenaria]|uniref:HPHL1-like protein n=1 Tax=Mya arenaria TaxID=6604 RepID=A0ABY7FDK9_MYAAR|nr:HPHL1-like protein [Mya arenaria]
MLLILRLCFVLLLVARSWARIRHYFIAAVEVNWDYAPSGRNLVGPDTYTSRRLIENRDNQIGSVYRKVLYREFTDATFTQQIPVPDWMGFVGPTVKAEVGDSVVISFRNMASKGNFSVHPHGYFYDKRGEGARYLDGTSGADKVDDGIPPGGSYVYTWHVTERHAPTADDDACVPWGYHGHTASPFDIATGLVGFALICKRGTLDANDKRKDVDKEFVVYADIADESKSFFFEESIQKCGKPGACKARANAGDEDFKLSNEMHHINGYVYGNQPPFQMCPGERAVFYVMSLNLASHIMRILGHTMIIKHRRTENALVNSASFLSAYTVAAHPGHWLLYCRNLDHVIEGMLAFVDVENKPVPSNIAGLGRRYGRMRTYYLAIEEIIWDYAPGLTPDSSSSEFLQQGPNRIGSRYKKAVYRLYTDGTFTTPVIRGPEDIHMGFTGPPIKGEEGDVIMVVLYNKASREYSFLAGGVSMSKENEGAVYKQNVQDTTTTGATVTPGTIRRYKFFVSSIDAPTKIDQDCLTYIYRSAVDLEKDFYSGLFGPMLICKPGKLDKPGKPGKKSRVEREFFLNFLVVNENLSHYLTENINMFATSPATVDPEDEGFQLSNKIRGLNKLRCGQLGLEKEGMFAWYNVDSCYSRLRIGRLPKLGITRRPSYIFVRGGPDFVGSIYTKTVYREFTDSTFTKMKPQHVNLGILGPYIRGNVGDTIEIHLKNMANFPLNIVPKNLPFADGSVISSALPTFPGTVGIYKYSIPKRSGPNKNQPNCVGTMYTSRVDPLKDAHSGLIGPMVICKEETLNGYGQRTDDISVEFATAYFIIDENLSHHSAANFALRAPGRVDVKNADFVKSNMYYSINGLIYGNLVDLTMRLGQRSAWYVFGMGMEDDIHTVHFHGQLYIRNTKLTLRGDVLEVFAGTYETVEMEAYNPGTWLFHCHVSGHVINGMETVYNRQKRSQSSISVCIIFEMLTYTKTHTQTTRSSRPVEDYLLMHIAILSYEVNRDETLIEVNCGTTSCVYL